MTEDGFKGVFDLLLVVDRDVFPERAQQGSYLPLSQSTKQVFISTVSVKRRVECFSIELSRRIISITASLFSLIFLPRLVIISKQKRLDVVVRATAYYRNIPAGLDVANCAKGYFSILLDIECLGIW